MRISAMILAMSTALPFPPPASGQSKAPTEAQCREAVNGMVSMMKSAPLEKEKDKQSAKVLIDQVEKLIRDNRAKGVSECATWASIAKIVTMQ